MRVGPALAVLLVGCGRLGFDDVARRDAPLTGHDEDGDFVADDEDRCPHIADDQTDSDDDGVGDACDRAPLAPGQRLVYFSAMRPEDPAWFPSGGGTWTQRADSREFDGSDGRNGQLTTAVPIGDSDIWIGTSITTRIEPTNAWQVAITVLQQTDSDPYYYVQFYEDVNSGYISVSHWDGAMYRQRGTMGIANGVHTGDVDLAMFIRQGPLEIDTKGAWGAEAYSATATAPLYIGGQKVTVVYEGVIAELRYVAVVSTQ